jgi:CCR4-NOT transcriptional complex subunit CAF120
MKGISMYLMIWILVGYIVYNWRGKWTDVETGGKPFAQRTWVECFAQLNGTSLSIWNARELEERGSTENVPPRYLNLADSAMKMV